MVLGRIRSVMAEREVRATFDAGTITARLCCGMAALWHLAIVVRIATPQPAQGAKAMTNPAGCSWPIAAKSAVRIIDPVRKMGP